MRGRSSVVNLIVLTLLVTGSCWGEGDRPLSPATQRIVLDNGVCVLFQHNAHSPTVAISALIRVHATRESNLTAGLRRLITLMTAAPQTTARDSGAWPAGLSLATLTTRDYVELLVQCMPAQFDQAMQTIRQRLFEIEFTAQQFELARQQMRREIQASDQLPVSLALNLVVEELYPEMAGAWPVHGTIASLSALTLAQVRKFYQENFWPNVTVVAVAGDVSWAEVRRCAQRDFGDLLPGAAQPGGVVFSPHPIIDRPRHGIIYGTGSSVVIVGGRAPTLTDAGYPAAVVLTALLGSGMGSRLYQSLRADQAMAYTVQAALTPAQVCSYAYVLAACSASNLDTVEQVIDQQLKNIAQQGITEAELQRAKRYVANSFVLNRQGNRDLAHYLSVFYGSGGLAGLQAYEQFCARLETVSAQQVQESCRDIFATHATVIIEGGEQ